MLWSPWSLCSLKPCLAYWYFRQASAARQVKSHGFTLHISSLVPKGLLGAGCDSLRAFHVWVN